MKKIFSEKIKILPLLLIFPLLLTACSSVSADLELVFSAFECDIVRRCNGEIFCAKISVGALADGERSISMSFTSPPSLSGLTVCRSNGVIGFSLGGSSLGEPPREYLRILDMLSPSGAFEYICKSEGSVCYSNGGSNWYFDAESGLPTRVENEEIKIEITRIGRSQG